MSNKETFKPGDQVTWLWTPGGGYGYTQAVPARVLKVTEKRVRIAVKLKDGGEKIRAVKPENLRHNTFLK